MKNLDEKLLENLQKIKVYEINKLRKLERKQQEFFDEIRELTQRELKRKKSADDFLSPKEVMDAVGISRKTFDRCVKKD